MHLSVCPLEELSTFIHGASIPCSPSHDATPHAKVTVVAMPCNGGRNGISFTWLFGLVHTLVREGHPVSRSRLGISYSIAGRSPPESFRHCCLDDATEATGHRQARKSGFPVPCLSGRLRCTDWRAPSLVSFSDRGFPAYRSPLEDAPMTMSCWSVKERMSRATVKAVAQPDRWACPGPAGRSAALHP